MLFLPSFCGQLGQGSMLCEKAIKFTQSLKIVQCY